MVLLRQRIRATPGLAPSGPATRCRSPEFSERSPHLVLPLTKIIRLLPTSMTQNPATAKITDTDRRLLVADELPSERGAADKLGDTGHARRAPPGLRPHPCPGTARRLTHSGPPAHHLTDLKNRGVSDTFFLVCDGWKGLTQVKALQRGLLGGEVPAGLFADRWLAAETY
jgi:hypothetical protein